MKILIVTQYFWPETFQVNDLALTLVKQGHEVTVATGKPNYPGGTTFPGYRPAGIVREEFLDRVSILRVPMRPRGAGGAISLARNYWSFLWSASLRLPILLRGERFDAILAFCPSPITSAIPAIVMRWRSGAPLAIWVQDLWPDSLSATGFVHSPAVLRSVDRLVRAIYARADALLVQSRAFIEPVARSAPGRRIIYLPNAVSGEAAGSSDDANLPSDLLDLLDRYFCVVFAGNIGTAQAMETIVDSAERLADLADVRIVLVGSGSRLAWVREARASRGLTNLVTAGRFAPDQMPAIYVRAQGLLLTLRRSAIFALTVPSKLQSYLAAGRPVIVSADGEAARVVLEAEAGLSSAAEDGAGLATAIRALRAASPARRDEMGRRGRAYFEAHFEIGQAARTLTDILGELASHRRDT